MNFWNGRLCQMGKRPETTGIVLDMIGLYVLLESEESVANQIK